MPTFAFTDLDRAVDRFHALCDAWAEGGPFVDRLGQDGLHVLRLTVHEWIANLVQHAHYPSEREIVIHIHADGDAVRCAIEDTSVGFDFAGQLEHQQALLSAPAPSERGRGLLMLVTCAEELEFRPAREGARQRIAFALRDPAGGDLAALFRAADLRDDPSFANSLCDESHSDESLGDESCPGEPFYGDGLPPDASPPAPPPATASAEDRR